MSPTPSRFTAAFFRDLGWKCEVSRRSLGQPKREAMAQLGVGRDKTSFEFCSAQKKFGFEWTSLSFWSLADGGEHRGRRCIKIFSVAKPDPITASYCDWFNPSFERLFSATALFWTRCQTLTDQAPLQNVILCSLYPSRAILKTRSNSF